MEALIETVYSTKSARGFLADWQFACEGPLGEDKYMPTWVESTALEIHGRLICGIYELTFVRR